MSSSGNLSVPITFQFAEMEVNDDKITTGHPSTSGTYANVPFITITKILDVHFLLGSYVIDKFLLRMCTNSSYAYVMVCSVAEVCKHSVDFPFGTLQTTNTQTIWTFTHIIQPERQV